MLKSVLGWTENSISEGDAATQKRLNRQISHDASITVDTILLVLDKYPCVSAEWLLRGSGEMLMENKYDQPVKMNDIHGNHNVFITNWGDLKDIIRDVIREERK